VSKQPKFELIVMRLADMHRVHPEQITAKCHGCGHVVAVYPSGQQVMREYPGVLLTCQVCKTPGPDAALAPGAELEPFESVKAPMKTLGDYRDFCATIADEDSPAVKFFDDRIRQQGRDEEVAADESQMLALIGSLLNSNKD
jgi:hypothetical protein